MSVKKILKELLEDNPDYSGRWDMDFKMDLQTKNHIRLVRLCQLLGFEDRTKVARKCGDPDPNLIRIEDGPFFQLKNVTYVEPWKHTEMVIDMEDKNEK